MSIVHFGGRPELSVGPPLHTACGFIPHEYGVGLYVLVSFDSCESSVDGGELLQASSFEQYESILESSDSSSVCDNVGAVDVEGSRRVGILEFIIRRQHLRVELGDDKHGLCDQS